MLRVYLLGSLRALADDRPLKLVFPPRTGPLWAFLLLQRAVPIPRDTLAFTFWPDQSETSARANLRRHLHQLQRALPPAAPERPWLLSDAATLQWNPGADDWLDVAEFERLSAEPEGLAGAVALYSGDLLENCYDDWLFAHRERLRQLYVDALTRLAGQQRARRDYPAAIAYAQRLLAYDPLREDTARLLVALRYEAGDRAGALQEYERFASRLRDELGVEPMPESVAVYEAALRQHRLPGFAQAPEKAEPTAEPFAPATPFARPSQLPFVGRAAEFERLRTAWNRAARGQGRLVLIGGEAGIGKTRLAGELASLAESQGARVLYGGTPRVQPAPAPHQALVEALSSALPLLATLDLPAVSLASVALLVPELRARRPDLPPLAALAPEREQARLVEALARCFAALAQPRPVLLVLEDLHSAGATTVGLLEDLAGRLAGHALLMVITYREEDLPRAHALHDLQRRVRQGQLAGEQLALARLAPQAVESLATHLTGLNASAAARLHAVSEGHPFFLGELIHGWRESGALPEPPGSAAAPAPWPERLDVALSARLAHLTPAGRALAEVAAVAGPAFDAELVREVGGWSEAQLLDGLDELLDRQMVRELGGRSRYDYAFAHHLIQETLYRQIPPAARRRRHRRAAQVGEALYGQRLDEVAAELALHFRRGDEAARAADYYERAAHHAVTLYADDEALGYVAQAVELNADREAPLELLALRETIHGRQGARPAQGEDLAQMSAQARARGDDDWTCEVLRRHILYQRALGERAGEAALIAELHEHATRSGAARWQAEALQAQGAHALLLGHYGEAQELITRAVAQRRALGDVAGEVESLCLLAENAVHLGQFEGALRVLEQSADLAAAQGNQALVARALLASALAAFVRQEYAHSYALAEQALALYRSIGDREGEADARVRLGNSATRLFRIAVAREHFADAQQLYADLRKPQGQAAVLVNSGSLAFRVGRYAEAVAAFEQADALFQLLEDRRGQTVCAVNLSWAAFLLGDPVRAKAAARRALDLARVTQNPFAEANALGNLGAIERDLGELDEGIAHMEAGLALRRQLGQAPDQATDLRDLALAYLRAGRRAAAQQAVVEMLDLFATAGDHVTDPHTLLWVAAQVEQATGQVARAEALVSRAFDLLQQAAAAIPDPESRATFLEQPFNRELRAAHVRGAWPSVSA